MNFYEKLSRLLEDTPSKTEIAVKLALGWPIRPEDEPGISKGTRRVRIMKRKGQTPGSIYSRVGKKRGRRKARSWVYSDQESGAVEHMLARKKAEGAAREEMTMYKGRPSRGKS